MPNRIQVRALNHVRQTSAKTAEAFDDLILGTGNLASQLQADPNGADIVPTPVAQVKVQQSNGFIDVAIVDNSPIARAINYYIIIASSPGDPNPRIIPNGPSRNYHTTLPNGTYYISAQSQYPHGGPPSSPVAAAAPVVISASAIGTLALFPSQGSGTGGGGAGKTLQRK